MIAAATAVWGWVNDLEPDVAFGQAGGEPVGVSRRIGTHHHSALHQIGIGGGLVASDESSGELGS